MPDEVADRIRAAGWREGAAEATLVEVRTDSIGRMSPPDEIPAPHGGDYLRPVSGEDPEVTSIGKWAVVALEDDRTRAAEAMAPLIEHRRGREELWEDGLLCVRPSASGSVESWNRRFERAAGDTPPHYLLILGGPDRFPFNFQNHLDLRRMTGRLDVCDEPGAGFSWAACRRYAEKVVAYERAEIQVGAKPLFYSLQSEEATRLSHQYLVKELARRVPLGVMELYGDDATVLKLEAALGGERSPGLVFTASHGVEYPSDPLRWGALTDATYRGRADDAVVSAKRVFARERFGHGAIIFAFACFSAGVPDRSTLSFLTGEEAAPQQMAARVAPLPRLLLGHARGPVAFVGHLDRVTGVAFQKSFGMAGIQPFHDFISWLRQKDATLGVALGTIREQARRVGTDVAASLERAAGADHIPSVREAGRKWIGFHDFRGFLLLGDPALTPCNGVGGD